MSMYFVCLIARKCVTISEAMILFVARQNEAGNIFPGLSFVKKSAGTVLFNKKIIVCDTIFPQKYHAVEKRA